MSHLHPLPQEYLTQLAEDRDIFKELPMSVQRQIWEIDRGLLQVRSFLRFVSSSLCLSNK